MTRFSIVTVSFNQAPYLEECVQSVLSQLGPGDEYIIVDPGSNDGSREIIKAIDRPNVRWIFEPDRGPADGLNRGFSSATGDVLFYLNSDDILLAGSLNKMRALFRQVNEDVVYGDGCIVNRGSFVIRHIQSARRFSVYRYLVGADVVLQQATFIRNSAFRAVGGFNINNRTCWDGELLLDLAAQGFRFRYVKEVIGAFRLYDESITGSQRLQAAYKVDKRRMFLEKLGRQPKASDALIGYVLRIRNRIFRALALLHRNDFPSLGSMPGARVDKVALDE